MQNNKFFELTLPQQDIYFHQLKNPGSPLYNVGGYIQMQNINLDRIRRAHEQLLNSEELFGLRISSDGAKQYISQECDTDLPLVDLSHESDALAAADAWAQSLFETAVEIIEQPLFRVFLLKISDHNYRYLALAHHLMMDGWGFANWASRINQLYNDESPELSPKGTWNEISAQDQTYLSSDKYRQSQTYWSEQSALTTDKLLAAYYKDQKSSSGAPAARFTYDVPAEQVSQANALATQLNSNISQVFLALVASYFSQAYQRDELVLGLPSHNRKNHAQKQMLGVFASISPLALEVSSDNGFKQLLNSITQQQRSNLRHQRYPIGHIIRDQGKHLEDFSLFDVGYNFLELDSHLNFNGDAAYLEYLSHNHETTPLMITVWHYGESNRIQFKIDYNFAYFTEQEVAELAQRVMAVLKQVHTQPDAPIKSLNLLTDNEYQRLITDSLQKVDYPRNLCVQQLIAKQVDKTPDAIAVCDQYRSLTYGQLDEKSNQLARYLNAQGIQGEAFVGIAMCRSVDMVIAILATLKAGAAYVPLEPGLPKSRLDYMIEDSDISVLLTQEAISSQFENQDVTVLAVDGPNADFNQLSVEPIDKQQASDTAAYLIYTSGSTGAPKGVVIEHSALVNRLTWMQNRYQLNENDRVLQKTPFSFDVSVWEFLWTLSYGGRLVMAKPEGHKDPQYLADVIAEQGISILHFVPSMLDAFLATQTPANSVRLLFCSGEALNSTSVARLQDLAPNVQMHNLYGPTEASIDVSAFACSEVPKSVGVPIGRAIQNVKLLVLNDDLTPVPTGIPGQLYIGGECLARGYHKRSELTQSSFVADPYSQEPGARLYKSGDVVRVLQDGNIAYLGRLDHQVKLRGFRIELGEIENQLLSLEYVANCCVVALDNPGGDKFLAAYVVLEDKSAFTADNLAKHCTEWLQVQLPDYMIPASFTVLDALPLSANGKLDRKALPCPNSLLLKGELASTETQAKLCQIWGQLLNRDGNTISVDVPFLALGGHSLHSIQLVAEVKKQLGITISVKDVFEHKTIAGLAQSIDANEYQQAEKIEPVANPGKRLPLSFAQRRLWLIDQSQNGSTDYNIISKLKLTGEVDSNAVQQALAQICERHEPLRSMFINDEEQVWVEVSEEIDFQLRQLDFSSLDAQEQRLTEFETSELNTCFDLQSDLKLRATLVCVAPQEHVVFVTIHHIAADGWSQKILYEEFSSFYKAIREDQPLDLPELDVQYSDYAVWQEEQFQGEKYQQLKDYWCNRLADIPKSHSLPLDHSRPQLASNVGETYSHQMSGEQKQQLLDFCQSLDVTPYMFLQSAYSLLLARFSGSDDIVIGSAVANREQDEIAPLVGFFANTLVLRAQIDWQQSFRDFVGLQKNHLLSDFKHQQLPFEALVETLNPERDNSINPLFQVVLNLIVDEDLHLDMPGIEAKKLENSHVVSNFDITLQVTLKADSVAFDWRYNSAIFNASTIACLADSMTRLMQNTMAKPELPLFSFELADASQINDMTMQNHGDDLLARFEAQTELNPDATALLFEQESLSYQALNQRANQLAHALMQKGVTGNKPVALVLERSLDLVVGILAVLKAGGYYIPMDPANPEERLTALLNDSGAVCVVTLPHLESFIPAIGQELCIVDFEDSALTGMPLVNPDIESDSEDLAYVIYTSGSTGKPKGVMVQRGSISIKLQQLAAEYGIDQQARILLFASYCFDASVTQLFMPLISGATSVIRPDDVSEPEDLMNYVNEHQVTMMHIVPQYLSYLMQDEMLSEWWPESPLKTLICGGDILHTSMLTQWFSNDISERIALYNSYGPTETTVTASIHRVYKEDLNSSSVSIGHGLADTRFYVVDDRMQLQPRGAVGELLIGGSGVAKGYLNQPELTANAFISGSVHKLVEDTLYRTGDIVRLLPDGNLLVLGRKDNQVKVRGFRIEIEEIEANLNALDAVSSAAVILLDDEQGNKDLLAYVALHHESAESCDSDSLMFELEQHLPGYMLPGQLTIVEALPLTSSGKINKQALLDANQLDTSFAVQMPENETQEALYVIWQGLLEEKSFGITDSFFKLGGHSLLATRLAGQIRKQFGVKFTLKTLFESPSIEEQAQAIDEMVTAQRQEEQAKQSAEVVDEFEL